MMYNEESALQMIFLRNVKFGYDNFSRQNVGIDNKKAEGNLKMNRVEKLHYEAKRGGGRVTHVYRGNM